MANTSKSVLKHGSDISLIAYNFTFHKDTSMWNMALLGETGLVFSKYVYLYVKIKVLVKGLRPTEILGSQTCWLQQADRSLLSHIFWVQTKPHAAAVHFLAYKNYYSCKQ